MEAACRSNCDGSFIFCADFPDVPAADHNGGRISGQLHVKDCPGTEIFMTAMATCSPTMNWHIPLRSRIMVPMIPTVKDINF